MRGCIRRRDRLVSRITGFLCAIAVTIRGGGHLGHFEMRFKDKAMQLIMAEPV